jgi:hypothetical protein
MLVRRSLNADLQIRLPSVVEYAIVRHMRLPSRRCERPVTAVMPPSGEMATPDEASFRAGEPTASAHRTEPSDVAKATVPTSALPPPWGRDVPVTTMVDPSGEAAEVVARSALASKSNDECQTTCGAAVALTFGMTKIETASDTTTATFGWPIVRRITPNLRFGTFSSRNRQPSQI